MANVSPSLPALLGGTPVVTLDSAEANRWPILTTEDEEAVLRVIRAGDLSLHPVTKELEADYRSYFGVEHALAHCNGTSALLAAFYAIGLKPGDEVLVPSATHWASVVPMLWVGDIPVFCESEPDRLGLDPDDVAAKITARTRSIVIVHLWGMPSRMTELLSLARRHDLRVIEDASHAQGATWRERWCGTLSDVGVFSLQSHKLAPAGEGGMLLTRSAAIHEQAMLLGDQMRILEFADDNPAKRFWGSSFGLKTRMAPISAAIARVQLRHLAARNQRRNDNLTYLSEHLEALGFQAFLPPAHVRRTYFEFILRIRDGCPLPLPGLLAALQAEGCEAEPMRYPLLHQQPLFTEGHYVRIARLSAAPRRYDPHALPRTEAAATRTFKLPSFPSAERPLLDQYVQAFTKVVDHAATIRRTLC